MSAKSRHRPDIPRDSLLELVQALRTAHERLSTPHARVRDEPEKLKNWKSPVRSEVDWSVLVPKGSQAVLARETKPERVPTPDERDIDEEGEGEREEPLTIGLVGQPNVGKSSLLNALLGEQRVRASKTPGKVRSVCRRASGPWLTVHRRNISRRCFGAGRRRSR